MKQTLLAFESAVATLNDEIKSHYQSKGIQEGDFVYDGIIDIKEYYDSPLKILWILKEPYSGSKREMLNDLRFRRAAGDKTDSRTTWHPIIYIAYSLTTKKFCDFDSIPKIKDDKTISNVLKKIAFINVQKTPELERSNPKSKRTNFKDISAAFKKHKEILLKQIDTYNPDIIIGAKTLSLFVNDLELKKEHEIKLHWTKNNKLYINTYHPAQIVMKPQEYIQKVINISKYWYETSYNENYL